MNCPRLPTVPASRVSQIEPSWFRALNECLQFAMTHPQGDGITVFNDAGGTLRASDRAGDGDGAVLIAASGPFAVDLYDAGTDGSPDRRIRLFNSKSRSGIAGLVTIGSFRTEIEDQEWTAQTGVVYLDVTFDPETEEYNIIFDLEPQLPETADERRYILRIAEITQDTETKIFTVHQIRDYGDIEISGRWVK